MSQMPGPFGRRYRALGVLALVGLFATACQLVDVPKDLTLPPLKQTSLLYDDHNHLIRSFHAVENRTVIPLDQMSNWALDAVVAIEDERFYEHRGIDLKALVRAAYANAKSGGIVQGGSTITEQLVKNTITGDAVTLGSKDQRGGHRLQPRAGAHQGVDPRAVPEHGVLRRGGLRHPGRVADLLRQAGQQAHAGPVRPPGRPHPVALEL